MYDSTNRRAAATWVREGLSVEYAATGRNLNWPDAAIGQRTCGLPVSFGQGQEVNLNLLEAELIKAYE